MQGRVYYWWAENIPILSLAQDTSSIYLEIHCMFILINDNERFSTLSRVRDLLIVRQQGLLDSTDWLTQWFIWIVIIVCCPSICLVSVRENRKPVFCVRMSVGLVAKIPKARQQIFIIHELFSTQFNHIYESWIMNHNHELCILWLWSLKSWVLHSISFLSESNFAIAQMLQLRLRVQWSHRNIMLMAIV